ncbi:EndoU domain-containing protein [Bacillus nitratireducens]|uniref:EndoU domain-containing protein n=1 Tax=Bacillus nitratireducens TaxID=2026193 RepID=UPI00387A7E38
MSINMYVSTSQRQASSASNMCKQQIQGYEQLQKAINDFTMNSPFLTGQAYDSAKKYFSSVLYPLAQAGILLTEAVERAVKKFPETYVAEVDSGDLKQAELEAKINQVNSMLLQAENIQSNLMSLNVPDLVGMKTAQLSANSMLIHMYRDVKKKLEEKLQKLIAFNASSPHIFSEIASLQQAVNQGLAQTKTAWNASSGTFTIPSPEALSWTKGIQGKWQDYAERHEPKIEVRAEKVNKGSVGEHTHYNVYVDGVFDEDKTKELKWMFDKESFKESAHFIGDFVFINDIYKSATGKDWLSEEKSSRTEAAGMLVLSVLPTKKLENIAKELKGGNKLLKGVELTEKEEKVLKEAGLLDKVGKVENVEKASKVKIKVDIPNKSIEHANLGDFTKNPKTGELSMMKGGGHGQDNISFLKENGFEVNIEKTYPNGVRIGNVPKHKSGSKRTGTGQSWFPASWKKTDIENAGQHIASLPEFSKAKDGEVIFGNYNGVRVGVIKTNGKIGTIFPDGTKQL